MIIADEFNFANGVRFTKTMNKVLTVTMLCEAGDLLHFAWHTYKQKLIYKQMLTNILLPLFCKAGVSSKLN